MTPKSFSESMLIPPQRPERAKPRRFLRLRWNQEPPQPGQPGRVQGTSPLGPCVDACEGHHSPMSYPNRVSLVESSRLVM